MIINSLLDTDLYKLSLQNAVRQHFATRQVIYRFTNRGGTLFSRQCYDKALEAINHLGSLRLLPKELEFLSRQCTYFSQDYLEYLSKFTFKPEQQVKIEFVKVKKDEDGLEWGKFEIEITGLWCETILYEVPIMAILSEAYFTTDDRLWDYQGQLEQAKTKGKELFLGGCMTSEFGTRRRRSYKAQQLVIEGMINAQKEYSTVDGRGKLTGTSNVHFAMKYDLTPIGTIAHEWIMGIAALRGYEGSNTLAMKLWDETYPSKALSIALTDTFTTKPFFDEFVKDVERSRTWRGLRQDSGDPLVFIGQAKEAFLKIGVDPKQKLIVFSDGLDVPTCLKLKKASDEAGVGCSFGVGTNLTNDFRHVSSPVSSPNDGSGPARVEGEKSKALNMVIKLFKVDDKYCIKISDDLTKSTGNAEEVQHAKDVFHLGKVNQES